MPELHIRPVEDCSRSMHWVRFRLELSDDRFKVFKHFGYKHGHTIDCGDPICDECNIWRLFIPFVELEYPVCRTPLGALLLQAA